MRLLLRGDRFLELEEPAIMGIVNATPDSFYPNSRTPDCESALSRAVEMIESGAAIVDIGGESTRPGAEPIPWREEVKRVLPVVEKLRKLKPEAVISLDTRNYQTAERGLDAGVDIINDVSGLRDAKMVEVVSARSAAVVIMHMRGTPATMSGLTTYKDVVGEVSQYLLKAAERAQAGGVTKEKIILDPGIGFAKGAQSSLEILRKLDVFTELGYPILIGHSRKSFIGLVSSLPVQDRLEETLALSSYLYLKGVKIIRVHEVEEHRRIFDILKLLV